MKWYFFMGIPWVNSQSIYKKYIKKPFFLSGISHHPWILQPVSITTYHNWNRTTSAPSHKSLSATFASHRHATSPRSISSPDDRCHYGLKRPQHRPHPTLPRQRPAPFIRRVRQSEQWRRRQGRRRGGGGAWGRGGPPGDG